MADGFRVKIDDAAVQRALSSMDKLANSLGRSMAVAGGELLRDVAKVLAPVGGAGPDGSITPGLLRSAIYLAYKDNSTHESIRYAVSWNSRKAPHGHLLEFGHWQPYKVYMTADGGFRTSKQKLDVPKWIEARPFLRPTIESSGARAVKAMLARGRERLPELLRESREASR